MTPRLSPALSAAVSLTGTVEAIDPATGRVFLLIDRDEYQAETGAAIQEGYDQIATGDGLPLREAEAALRRELGFSSAL